MRLDALFVYGTLKRGGSNHALVACHARVEPALARGRLYALLEGYPALIERGEDEVRGEVLFFDDRSPELGALDALEGYEPLHPESSLFLRVRREVWVPTLDRRVLAWVYVMPADREPALVRAGARRLVHGEWIAERMA